MAVSKILPGCTLLRRASRTFGASNQAPEERGCASNHTLYQ